MTAAAPALTDALRTRITQSDLAIRKPAFLRPMRAKVLDRDPSRLLALLVGSLVSWLGVHVAGATPDRQDADPADRIRGDGWACKAFARRIDTLMRSGNAWSIPQDGKVILMAGEHQENASALTRFKRAPSDSAPGRNRSSVARKSLSLSWYPASPLKRRFDFTGRCGVPATANPARNPHRCLNLADMASDRAQILITAVDQTRPALDSIRNNLGAWVTKPAVCRDCWQD